MTPWGLANFKKKNLDERHSLAFIESTKFLQKVLQVITGECTI
jgi:glycine cleavage system H lipoate-binding protein